MEYVIIPSKKEDILKYQKLGINTFIVGVENLSSGYLFTMSLDEIKSLSNQVNLYVAINKMIENKELSYLEASLNFLNKTTVKGVLYYDLSTPSIKKKYNLNLDLVWNQTHMVTNYNTANFYYNEGVKYGYISNEITLEEILEINEKSKMSFFVNIISKPIMSHSKRNLLSNYFKVNNQKKTEDTYILSEKDKTDKFLISEDMTGTTIRYGNIINGTYFIKELIESGITYLVIDTTYIEEEKIVETVKNILEIPQILNTSEYKKKLASLETILGNDTGFFNKKTIYKVKK